MSATLSDGRSSPEKFEALYVLIFIHVKMTLEELAQQLEAVFTSIQSAYSDVVVSNTLSTIMVQWNRLSPRGSFVLRAIVH